VAFYRERGFLPWALCNFLLLLGWSAEDNREILSREEAIREFSLERIGRANSVFNYNPDDPKFFTDPKALSINAHYLRTMDIEELGRLVADELKTAGLWKDEYEAQGRARYLQILDMIRARFHTLKDFVADGRAYFSEDFPITEAALEKNLKKEPRLREWLPELAARLEKTEPFDLANTEAAVRAFADEKEIKAGVIINAVRAAVTGQIKGPGLFEILVVLGPESTAARLRRAATLV
jgi:glutamyl-tRNA synthetase